MCNFFSFVSDPSKPIPERFMYMDWPTRQKIIAKELNYETDSHTSVADFFGYKGKAEDSLNKYEYNPLLGKFQVDQINNKIDDSAEAKKWVHELDFKKVVAPLIIKPIVHPFEIAPPEITPEILELLRQWASVRASVRASVWTSVRALVWDSVWASVWDSVWASVWASVRASVRASVWASVWDSVGDSVRDSVGAYTSSFFEIKYEHDFSPVVALWEMGLVPSYDGKAWRLHGGKGAAALWAGTV